MGKRMAADPILSSALNTINLDEIKREMGPSPWVRSVVLTDYVFGNLICQTSAVTTDNHVHDYDEWWLVLEGEIHWVIEGRAEPVRATAGDFIFVPALTFHHILPQGDTPSIRLAISMPGHPHLHTRPQRKAQVTIT